MIKTLKKRGNSHMLLIDKAIIEQLNITPQTRLQLVVSNGSLIVTPTRVGVGEERVDEAMAALRETHGEVWAELAK